MGKGMFDLWSFGHFYLGYLSYLVIYPNNLTRNFIVSNLIHLALEITEQRKTPDNIILETFKNRVGDTLIFNLGWIFAYITKFKKFNKYIYILLCLVFLVSYLEQFLREIFPNTDLIFTKGAFLK